MAEPERQLQAVRTLGNGAVADADDLEVSRSSSGRSTSSAAPSWRTVMSAGIRRNREPFGPFTVTSLPATLTSTPEGIWMGALPIRDISGHQLDYQT
jgi:hypothetical protein